MTSTSSTELLGAALGPALLGALVGLEIDVFGAVHNLLVLPAVLAGLAAVMLPALYIGSALAGADPRAAELGRATLAGLGRMGIAILGLSAPAAFLLATTESAAVASLLLTLVLGIGALCGLRALYRTSGTRDTARGALIFLSWSVIVVGVGARLVATHVSA